MLISDDVKLKQRHAVGDAVLNSVILFVTLVEFIVEFIQ